MAKIYFSETNTRKLNNKNAKFLLEKFSVDRPEPRTRTKKDAKQIKASKTKPISTPISKLKLTPKARKEAQKLARARYLSTLRFSDYRPFHIASSSTSHTSTTRQKKEKALINTTNSDYHNYAGEYEARNVEFGHGRTRSKEWNDSEALKWQKDIENLRKQQRQDPNTFDRFAMK